MKELSLRYSEEEEEEEAAAVLRRGAADWLGGPETWLRYNPPGLLPSIRLRRIIFWQGHMGKLHSKNSSMSSSILRARNNGISKSEAT